MAKKIKVPKKIAGIEVPKKVRKQTKKAVRLAENPAVRELAMAALGAAALKLAERAEARQAAKSTAASVKQEVAELEEQTDDARAQLRREVARFGDVIRAAALEGARQFIENLEKAEGRQSSSKKRKAKES